ncbi:TPA: hypothetical protein DDW35_04280 [Candidatus Sumerlaeota bacterium]|jgi:hypothetical protein|nr:hypothetical protein [Candidatus Sumerlaeota bacterium]
MQRTFLFLLLILTSLLPVAYAGDEEYADEEKSDGDNFRKILAEQPEKRPELLCDWTTLTLAVVNNDCAVVEQALQNGEDVDAVDRQGRSLLFLAKAYERSEMVKLLAGKGAEEKYHSLNAGGVGAIEANVLFEEWNFKKISNAEKTTDTQKAESDNNNHEWFIGETRDGNDHAICKSLCQKNGPDKFVLYESESSHKEMDGGDPGSSVNWLVPQRLLQANWGYVSGGSGHFTFHDAALFLCENNNIKQSYKIYSYSGGYYREAEWHSGNRAIDWDTTQSLLFIGKRQYGKDISGFYGKKDYGLNHDSAIFNCCKITPENKLELVYKGKVELNRENVPIVHVAQQNQMTVADIWRLNPELNGKVFCDKVVFVDASGPLDKNWLMPRFTQLTTPQK